MHSLLLVIVAASRNLEHRPGRPIQPREPLVLTRHQGYGPTGDSAELSRSTLSLELGTVRYCERPLWWQGDLMRHNYPLIIIGLLGTQQVLCNDCNLSSKIPASSSGVYSCRLLAAPDPP